jgi:acyl-CoA thioester hydrolase
MPQSFVFPLRVYVEDSDFGGIVYHSNYLNFMERARTEWLDTLNMGVDYWAKKEVLFIVRHADINFVAPAKVNARLNVLTEVEQVKGSSIAFKHRIVSQDDPEAALCEATVHIVCVNRAIRPVRVPDALREVLV